MRSTFTKKAEAELKSAAKTAEIVDGEACQHVDELCHKIKFHER
jgi:hypothetical protein